MCTNCFSLIQWARWWVLQFCFSVNSTRKCSLQECGTCRYVNYIAECTDWLKCLFWNSKVLLNNYLAIEEVSPSSSIRKYSTWLLMFKCNTSDWYFQLTPFFLQTLLLVQLLHSKTLVQEELFYIHIIIFTPKNILLSSNRSVCFNMNFS